MKVKLIRDKLRPEGEGIEVRAVNSVAGKHALLIKKLYEEVGEIDEAATDPTEYGDVIEALKELARINDVDWAEIERVALEKRRERGGFRRGLVMVRV